MSLESIANRLSINRPTKRGKEKSPSDGHCQCEKKRDDHLLACQYTPVSKNAMSTNDINDI
jgi:hypothetical protein